MNPTKYQRVTILKEKFIWNLTVGGYIHPGIRVDAKKKTENRKQCSPHDSVCSMRKNKKNNVHCSLQNYASTQPFDGDHQSFSMALSTAQLMHLI